MVDLNLWPYAACYFSTMCFHLRTMKGPYLKFLSISLLITDYQTVIPLAVQYMSSKMLFKEVHLCQNGVHVPDWASIWVHCHPMPAMSTWSWILQLGFSLHNIIFHLIILLDYPSSGQVCFCSSHLEGLSRSLEFFTRQTKSNFAHTDLLTWFLVVKPTMTQQAPL